MHAYKKYLTSLWSVFLLIFIAVLVHRTWFDFSTILTHGDWIYWHKETVKELLTGWGTWIQFMNLGSPNIQTSQYLFMSAWYLLSQLGVTFDQAAKLTFFVPISLSTFLSSYYLVKKLTRCNLAAVVASIYYGTTVYGIINQPPIQMIYALAPLLIHIFINSCESNRGRDWVVLALIYTIGVCYEPRVMYIVTFILSILFVLHIFLGLKNIKRVLLRIPFFISLTLLLNLFWLLPLILGDTYGAVEKIANRGLFGNNLFTLTQSIVVFPWNWTGGIPNIQFINQPVLWYFWLIPIITIFALMTMRGAYKGKYLLYFLILVCIGVFFSKQTSQPFGNLYKSLYSFFPGFNLFREASKFYLITCLGYMGVIGYAVSYINKYHPTRRFLSVFMVFVLVSSSLLNSKPFFTGEIGSITVPRAIPNEYNLVKQYILSDPEFSRILYVPFISRWGIATTLHPKVGFNYLQDWVLKAESKNLKSREKIGFFNQSYAHQALSIMSIKYIVLVTNDTKLDDIYFSSDADRISQKNRLNNTRYLGKINLNTSSLSIYENVESRPHIYTTYVKETISDNISYEKIAYSSANPTMYTISAANISKPFFINFSESFHPGWKLRVGDFKWSDAVLMSNYSLQNNIHIENDSGLNSFYIDPISICKKYRCEKNSDGSYNISFTLFFRPQSYFYLGLIISIVTFVLCIIYLFYGHFRERLARFKE